MKKILAASFLAVGLVMSLATGARAQTAPADIALYRTFGEKPGLVRLMDDFMLRLDADARMRPHFKDANKLRVKEQLVEQFCAVTGGPCVYKGADMKTSHADLEINKGDFNRLVEVLQQSMDAQAIPFGAQNRLLAQLAHMHRDIVTVK